MTTKQKYVADLVLAGKISQAQGAAWLQGQPLSGLGACQYGCPEPAQAQTVMQSCGCPPGAPTQQLAYVNTPSLAGEGLGQAGGGISWGPLLIGLAIGTIGSDTIKSIFGLGQKATHKGLKKLEARLD